MLLGAAVAPNYAAKWQRMPRGQVRQNSHPRSNKIPPKVSARSAIGKALVISLLLIVVVAPRTADIANKALNDDCGDDRGE